MASVSSLAADAIAEFKDQRFVTCEDTLDDIVQDVKRAFEHLEDAQFAADSSEDDGSPEDR